MRQKFLKDKNGYYSPITDVGSIVDANGNNPFEKLNKRVFSLESSVAGQKEEVLIFSDIVVPGQSSIDLNLFSGHNYIIRTDLGIDWDLTMRSSTYNPIPINVSFVAKGDGIGFRWDSGAVSTEGLVEVYEIKDVKDKIVRDLASFNEDTDGYYFDKSSVRRQALLGYRNNSSTYSVSQLSVSGQSADIYFDVSKIHNVKEGDDVLIISEKISHFLWKVRLYINGLLLDIQHLDFPFVNITGTASYPQGVYEITINDIEI